MLTSHAAQRSGRSCVAQPQQRSGLCRTPRLTHRAIFQQEQSWRTFHSFRPSCFVRCQTRNSSCDDDDDCEQSEPSPLEIHHMHEESRMETLALGPDHSWYYCTEDGDPRGYWSDGLPDGLTNKLHDPEQILPRVMYAAFTDDSWFVRFEDESCDWHVSDELQVVLSRDDADPCAVYFGPQSAYVILDYDDGLEYANLPGRMEKTLLTAQKKHGGVKSVAMGPDGEWFVKAYNGNFWWNAVHPSLKRLFNTDLSWRGAVKRVRLGPNGTYWAEFEKCTVWRGKEDLTEELSLIKGA